MLPTFLGIGVPRSGTTWLHELLQAHPEVYVPKHRKEIHFFDRNYERGIGWYEKFFPSDVQANKYRAIGEITPCYLYDDHCLQRILKMPSITKLIVILRNPIDRAYSHYGCFIRDGICSGPFEDCITQHPKIIQQSFYSDHLKKYLRHFKRDHMLVLIHEQTVAGSFSKAKETLGRFLGIDAERFSSTAGIKKVNSSDIPDAHSAYIFCAKFGERLKDMDLDYIVSLSKRLGIRQLFGKRTSLPQMSKETRQHLKELYIPEIRKLESLLSINLECWK